MAQFPISRLDVESFGPFATLTLHFSDRLNIVMGDNGTGKSQLLKLLYAVSVPLLRADSLTKGQLNRDIAARLVGVFRPDSLGRLTNRGPGRARADVAVEFKGLRSDLAFSFASNSKSEVITSSVPDRCLADTPVFLPVHELMSLYPGFVSLYDERQLEFDETWRDTASLLGRPALRGPRTEDVARVLEPIESILNGTIQDSSGRFVLHRPGLGNFEMPLVAEGLRKLAMIVRLVQSGTLLNSGYLFWDEPEANLNPRSLVPLAQVIVELALSGVQVFVATHSVFLLRELHLALDAAGQADGAPISRIVALRSTELGVIAEQADDVDDIPLDFLASLGAEIGQTERALGVVAHD